jgi:hypothetical protein
MTLYFTSKTFFLVSGSEIVECKAAAAGARGVADTATSEAATTVTPGAFALCANWAVRIAGTMILLSSS